MPSYSFTGWDGDVLVINSATGIATYKAITYRRPCTLAMHRDGRMFMKVVSSDLLASIDFSTIQSVESNLRGAFIFITFSSSIHLFLKRASPGPNPALPGNRRVLAPPS